MKENSDKINPEIYVVEAQLAIIEAQIEADYKMMKVKQAEVIKEIAYVKAICYELIEKLEKQEMEVNEKIKKIELKLK